MISALLALGLISGSSDGAEPYLPASLAAVEQSQTEIELTRAPSFLLVDGDAAVGTICASQELGNQVLLDMVERIRVATGIDPELAVVLATAPIGCDDIFYLPVANDIRGIGYQHQDPRELFDDSPESRLEGIAFQNDFVYWSEHPEEFARSFNHELGHRWGARVHATIEGVPPEALLGRQQLHWSYFFDSGGSPLEGNTWTDLDDRRYRAFTPLGGGKFSDFDLYLMGVLPKEDVAPARLLRATPGNTTDCKGSPLGVASPPQWCNPLDLDAEAVPVSIDTVIAAEGERSPNAESTTKTIDVAVIVVNTDGAPLHAQDCSALSTVLEERLAAFEDATGGRILLNNLTASNVSCQAWEALDTKTEGGGCALGGLARKQGWGASATVAAVLGWLCWWRRNRGSSSSPAASS